MVGATERENAENAKTSSARSARKLGIVLSTIYLAVLGYFCIRFSVLPGPEFMVLLFLIYALCAKWAQRFLRDWVPFIVLFLAFEAMRGIPYGVFGVVHYTELASVELRIFGTIPTLVLQKFFRSAFLDYFGAFSTLCTSSFQRCLLSGCGSFLTRITGSTFLLFFCVLMLPS